MFKQNYTPDHRRHPGSGGFLISRARIEAERRWGRRFFAVVFGIWITTVLAFGAIAVNWYLHVSLAQFVLMVLFLFRDRKSTRLNSSHDQISYAVFCLKKKK